MTRNRSPGFHLLDMLAKVPDPRKKKGLRHPLEVMLGVLVVGLLCDQKGYTCIAMWIRSQPVLTQVYEYHIERATSRPEKSHTSRSFVLRFTGHTKISKALREFAARPKLAVNLIHS